MDPVIRLMQVSKVFGPHWAVEQVDLEVHRGEIFCLAGPDGAGKSTLARLAAGALAPTAGRVEPDSRGRVGYMPARFSLYPDLTVWENLLFFARVYGMPRAKAESEARRLLDWVGLLPFKDRLSGALSGGMRQKLALACALIHRPPILILDEPTTAVDPVARADFWKLLREQAAEGAAILVTTPYLDEAEGCHRVGLLHEGRLIATGTAGALKAQLPWRMALLRPAEGHSPTRAELAAAARRLPGQRAAIPMGLGVRVALEREAPLTAPLGYVLEEVPTRLEDVYLWLSGAWQEVQAL
jgi:ABC-2 type transport system ATP-binding protein